MPPQRPRLRRGPVTSPESSRAGSGALPITVNSAATAEAVAASTSRPSGGQQCSSVHSRLHQRPPSMRSASRTSMPASAARSSMRVEECGICRLRGREHENQLVGRIGHRVVPHRAQPGADGRPRSAGRSSRWVSAMRRSCSQTATALSRGWNPSRYGTAATSASGLRRTSWSSAGAGAGVGVMRRPCPAGHRHCDARDRAVDERPTIARPCGRRQPKMDSRSSTDDSRSAGCRRCCPLVTM